MSAPFPVSVPPNDDCHEVNVCINLDISNLDAEPSYYASLGIRVIAGQQVVSLRAALNAVCVHLPLLKELELDIGFSDQTGVLHRLPLLPLVTPPLVTQPLHEHEPLLVDHDEDDIFGLALARTTIHVWAPPETELHLAAALAHARTPTPEPTPTPGPGPAQPWEGICSSDHERLVGHLRDMFVPNGPTVYVPMKTLRQCLDRIRPLIDSYSDFVSLFERVGQKFKCPSWYDIHGRSFAYYPVCHADLIEAFFGTACRALVDEFRWLVQYGDTYPAIEEWIAHPDAAPAAAELNTMTRTEFQRHWQQYHGVPTRFNQYRPAIWKDAATVAHELQLELALALMHVPH